MKTVTFNPLTHKVLPIELTGKMASALCGYDDPNEDDINDAKHDYSVAIQSAPEYPSDAGWISVDERLPSIGQIVDICINGVVQNETYELDCGDTSDYAPHEYFWSRDCIADYPDVKPGQYWKARPLPPAPEAK